MKKRINKKTLILLSLLLLLPLFSGCFLFPSTNHAPTITSSSITTATVDVLYTYDVEATDPDDGDTLTYSLTTNPTGMTIDSTTGVISWTPTSDQIGDHNVTVEVSDGELNDSQNFIIVVSEAPPAPPSPTPTNHAPTITSTQITTATVDALYTYDVNATDSDGDTLTYSLTANPTGMTIDSATGVISWTPNSSQIGDNDVTVEVSDGEKSTTQSFTVKVYDILTSITVLPETMSLFVGEDGTLASITASYNYGSDKVIALNDPDCSYSWGTGGIASVTDGVVTGVTAGSDTLTVSYEENSVTKTDTVVVTVNPIVLTSITVLPETMSLFVGEDGTLASITASYNYGSDKVIALNDPDCSYSWGTGGIASVTDGVVTGVTAGSDTLTVSYEENSVTKTDTVVVTVNPIVLTSITVLPETMSLFVGEDGTLASITASYNYGSDKVIALNDPDCSYSWGTGGIASVTDGVVTGVTAGSDTLTVSYEENSVTKTDTVVVTVNPIVLTSITVLPETMSLFVGEDGTLASITASYNYGSDKVIALNDPDCSYSWGTGGIASVTDGVVTGVTAGSDTLTVSYEENSVTKTDTVVVTIVADILISPSTITVTTGNSFTIDIVVENISELQGVTVGLGFDDSVIAYNTAAAGGFLPAPIFFPPPAGSVTNQVLLSIAGTGIPPYSSGTGTVLTVTFDALAAGTTDISFYLTDLRHDVFTPIPHKVKGECSVTVN